ncbi:MAG: DinB family protein [Chloroflexota bacterium]|nr:DinB family protein [Chloroflexota bacterium]
MDPQVYYGYVCAARAELWSFLQSLPEEDLDKAVIPGERFRSIKHLLLHIADVEDYWVHEVIRGVESIFASTWPHDRLAPNAERHPLEWIHTYTLAVQHATEIYLRALDASELGRVVQQRPPQPQIPYAVESLLWHTLTHEVRHSAQVALLARQLGHTPPWLDFARFAPPAHAPAQPAPPNESVAGDMRPAIIAPQS